MNKTYSFVGRLCLLVLLFASPIVTVFAIDEFELSSPAFGENSLIPIEYTLDGINKSPPMNWQNAPRNVKSFALLCIDGDAPGAAFVHWVLYNIPPFSISLPGGLPKERTLTGGMVQGKNDFDSEEYSGIGWDGPQPPSGTHRYTFRIFALDTRLVFKGDATRAMIRKAIEGHVLAQASLMGTYAAP